jgi:hypothetical protein
MAAAIWLASCIWLQVLSIANIVSARLHSRARAPMMARTKFNPARLAAGAFCVSVFRPTPRTPLLGFRA